MKRLTLGAIATVAIAGTLLTVRLSAAEESKPAAAAEFKLPPGWTAEDMQKFMVAATPGEMHKVLAAGAGEWTGTNTMWMHPGAEPVKSKCTSTVTPIMDGRFFKCEMVGEMPGMGPYHGLGIYGYDNVSKTFNCTWLDNHSTGTSIGAGELSADGKALHWKFSHSCPLTGKPTVMREIETMTGPKSKTLEMFGSDPKTGKELQMMKIELMRK